MGQQAAAAAGVPKCLAGIPQDRPAQ
jgi:hypothetical protein